MAIQASDMLFRLSGGSSNSDVNASLGGVMSTTTTVTDNTTHNLFDQVSGSESAAGDTEYRGIYVLNNHGSLTAQNTKVYITSNTPHSNTTINIALAGEGLNATMETVANENTSPSGESFTAPTTYAGGLDMTNIPSGQRYGLWIQRVVTAGATAANDDAATLEIGLDTAA